MDTTSLGSLRNPDYFMLIGYFIMMLGIGAYFYRRMKRMKDYFSGGNAIPWWLSGVSFYMTSFSVAAFVFYPSLCYRYGWVGVTLLWVAIPATLFSAMLFAAKWRRARIDSPVEYIETRYSPLLRQLFAWQGIPVRVIDDALKLIATGTFISVCAGIPIGDSILYAGLIILVYTFMGGLWAVTVTDFIQFIVLTAALLVILPLSILKAGGFGAIFAHSPEGFFHLTTPEFGWSYVIPTVALYALAWSSINWGLIQKYYCVPGERDAVKVGMVVVALYILGPPMMFFPAIAARQFIPELADAGKIYPVLCTQLLPAGMMGLALAAMFSATMSTLSGDFNVCASVLTNDVYKRLIRPNAEQKELVLAGRLMTAAIGLTTLGVAFAMSGGKTENMFRTMMTLFGVAASPVAVPMLLGLVSKRFSNQNAMAGFVSGLAVGLALYALSRIKVATAFGPAQWIPDKEEILLGTFAMKMEIVMFLSTSLTTWGVMEAASRLFPASGEARERIDAFHRRLHTPIGQLPEDLAHGEQSAPPSPFGVVGVCVLAIGLMMLCVLPWTGGGAVAAIDGVLGGGLLLLGLALSLGKRLLRRTAA